MKGLLVLLLVVSTYAVAYPGNQMTLKIRDPIPLPDMRMVEPVPETERAIHEVYDAAVKRLNQARLEFTRVIIQEVVDTVVLGGNRKCYPISDVRLAHVQPQRFCQWWDEEAFAPAAKCEFARKPIVLHFGTEWTEDICFDLK